MSLLPKIYAPWSSFKLALVVSVILGFFAFSNNLVFADHPQIDAPPLKGAIHTTLPVGEVVNGNTQYEFKDEVFLTGGPGPNAPTHAAALPDGYYYFQITDPSGKCLLSSKISDVNNKGGTCNKPFAAEPLECRKFQVEGGLITNVFGSTYMTYKGNSNKIDNPSYLCTHEKNMDTFRGEGYVVGMFPYGTTPNPGNVYKAWVAPVDDVRRACGYPLDSWHPDKGPEDNVMNGETGETCTNGVWGFVHSESKTDNFKVLERRESSLSVAARSFHDKNLNCIYDDGDELVFNWQYALHDPFSAGDPMVTQSQTRNLSLLSDNTADESTDPTLRFDIIGKQYLLWAIDQFNVAGDGFFGSSDTGTGLGALLNTPNSVTTFADVYDYLPWDGSGQILHASNVPSDRHVSFSLPIVCDPSKDVRSGVSASIDGDEDATIPDGTYEARTMVQDNDGFVAGFKPSDHLPADVVDGISYRPGRDPVPDPVLTVSMGSIGYANTTVCKFYDTSGNGVWDDGEPGIAGWTIKLEVPTKANGGTLNIPATVAPSDSDCPSANLNSDLYNAVNDKFGSEEDPISEMCNSVVTRITGDDGCVEIRVLIPNDLDPTLVVNDYYELSEVVPPNWIATAPENNDNDPRFMFDVRSELSYVNGMPDIRGVTYPDNAEGNDPYPADFSFDFGNICVLPPVDFGTKGYWHNKNGLSVINGYPDVMPNDGIPDFVNFVNMLPPYRAPSGYFEGTVRGGDIDVGEEPFDGKNESNQAVPSAYNNDNVTLAAPAGSALAEVSHFLVNRNNDGTGAMNGKEQLAQQLLAFLFNIHFQTEAMLSCAEMPCNSVSGGPTIYVSGGSPVDSTELINMAIAAWLGHMYMGQYVDINSIKNILDWWNNREMEVLIVPTLEQCLATVR